MKKIYVGVVLADYATPICMGMDKQKVEEKMESYEFQQRWWIENYNLNENNIIEFDT